MTATLLLHSDAPRQEWLDRRREGVTASEIATILGLNPWDSPFNLYWRKLGEIPGQADNTAMSLGRWLEPWIADQWAADHPWIHVQPSGLYRNNDRIWQMSTPDRDLYYDLTTSVQHILEIKHSASYDGWGDEGTDQIPVYYRAQVLWQLDTLGLSEAHVTCFFLHTRQRRDYVVSYDIRDVDLMRQAALDFLDRLADRVPPPVDGHKATLAALKTLHPKVEDGSVEVPVRLALDYEAACVAVHQADEEKERLENQLRYLMGSAKTATCAGQKVASRSIYEVREQVRKSYWVDRLNHPRTPKDPA